MKNKKGISLIVLIVTIIVIIILAAAVILTMNNNNPISSAKEATFKEDIRGFQDELSMTISKLYVDNHGQRDEKIYTENYITDSTNSEYDKSIYKYIPSFKSKYDNKFKIENDKLVAIKENLDEKEEEYITSLNIVIKDSNDTDSGNNNDSDTGLDDTQTTKVYTVGEQVKLKDNNYWRVVSVGDTNYITLLRETKLEEPSVFDSNTEYGYSSSHVEWVLNNEYLNTLKSVEGFAWDDNSSVRLLSWDEYTSLKEISGSSSWLYGDNLDYWWCTRIYNLRALVYPDGTINEDNSGFSNNVRPVIVTSKDNII